jgi:acyl dehydratase
MNMLQPIRQPATDTAFDPKSFLIVPAKRFEDLKVGDAFRAPSRTVTDAHTSVFQAISVDNHPRHYNADYAKSHGLPAPLVQPLQVLAFSAQGASLFTHYVGEVLEAFTETSCKFVKDSFVGDTLYTTLEITELSTKGAKGQVTTSITILNHRGELVLTGQQKFVLRLEATQH